MQESLLKDETLAHKLISKWSWMYLFALLWLPLGYAIRVIISNDLSVWEVGIIYWLLSLIGLLGVFSSLGLSWWTLVYFLPKYYVENNKDFVTTIYTVVRYLNICMTLIFALLIHFFIKNYGNIYINHPEIEKILYLFLAVFIVMNLANPIRWIFDTFQNVFVPQLWWFISQLTVASIILWVYMFWVWSIFNYSIAFLVGNTILLIILYVFYIKKYHSEISAWKFVRNTLLYKNLITFWLNALIASNAMIIISSVDMQMLLVLSDSANAWYYTNYMSLAVIIWFFIGPILWIIFPIISELSSKKNIKKLSLMQDFLYKYFVFFALSIWVLLVVFWEVISVILFWEDFLYSGTLLRYLWIFWVFQIIFSINLSILAWIWKLNISRNILIFTMILNIILNSILIPSLWALWAGIATVISWVIIALSSFYYVNKSTKINFDWVFYIKNTMIIWEVFDAKQFNKWIIEPFCNQENSLFGYMSEMQKSGEQLTLTQIIDGLVKKYNIVCKNIIFSINNEPSTI